MKTNILKAVLPVVFGIAAVLGLLIFYNILVKNGDAFSKPDNGFFKYFVPVTTLIAILLQIVLALPLWNVFKKRKEIRGMSMVRFTAMICVVSGVIFGFVFWERNLGIGELLAVSLTGIIAFAVYWTVNLFTLKRLDKLEA